MRALLITAPHTATVAEVEPPTAGGGQVVVDVSRGGVCGTDTALAAGEPDRLAHLGNTLPLRLGHEWCGVIASVGEDVDEDLIGRRVTGDTMIGCGSCARCRSGRHHVCENRFEIGVRRWAGALAEQVLVPLTNIHELPDSIDDNSGAMIEPGANAWRSVEGADIRSGDRVLIIGPGTIGLIAAQMARARGAEVHLLGRSTRSNILAQAVGLDPIWTSETLPTDLLWNAVIDASNSSSSPGLALNLVETGGRISLIGMGAETAHLDARLLVRKEVAMVGLLGGSAGIPPTIAAYAQGDVTVAPLIRPVLDLDGAAAWFNGESTEGIAGIKTLIDPRIR